jgi:hypothetical protein
VGQDHNPARRDPQARARGVDDPDEVQLRPHGAPRCGERSAHGGEPRGTGEDRQTAPLPFAMTIRRPSRSPRRSVPRLASSRRSWRSAPSLACGSLRRQRSGPAPSTRPTWPDDARSRARCAASSTSSRRRRAPSATYPSRGASPTRSPTTSHRWAPFGEEGWLFQSDNALLNRNSASHQWRKIREATGLEEFTLHNLRYFYASGLIAAGCDIVTVQRALGHASAAITLNTYSHLWPTAEDRTRSAAADLMRQCGLCADSSYPIDR